MEVVMSQSINKSQLVLAIGSIVIGILFFIFPGQIMNIIFYAIGALIFLFGLVNLIITIKDHSKEINNYRPLILIDVIMMILGLVFVAIAWLFVYVFVVVLGISFILLGIWNCYIAIVDPTLNTLNKVLKFIVAISDIIIGILLFINIGASANWIMYFLGTLLVGNGLIDFISFFKAISDNKKKEEEAINSRPIDVEPSKVIDVEVVESEVVDK